MPSPPSDGSGAGVGTSKLYDVPDGPKVWEMKLEPGETAALHTHTRPYMFYIISGGTLEVHDAAGASLGVFTLTAGSCSGFKLSCDKTMLEPAVADQEMDAHIPVAHSATNVGDTTFHEVLFEH